MFQTTNQHSSTFYLKWSQHTWTTSDSLCPTPSCDAHLSICMSRHKKHHVHHLSCYEYLFYGIISHEKWAMSCHGLHFGKCKQITKESTSHIPSYPVLIPIEVIDINGPFSIAISIVFPYTHHTIPVKSLKMPQNPIEPWFLRTMKRKNNNL